MARRSTTKKTEAEPSTKATEEASMTSTTTEAPTSENTEATESDAREETPIDLSAFETAVAAAVAEADKSTGTVPEAEVAKVVTEYRNLAGGVKAKNAAKKFLNEGMKSAMNEADIVKARAFLELSESMTAGSSGTSTPRQPADPTEAFVQADATLRLAQTLHTPGEGVAEDWTERVEKLVSESQSAAEQYLAWVKDTSDDKGDEPEVTSVVKNAVKLALGKPAKAGSVRAAAGGYTGERRDIGKHILEAFAEKEEGDFLSVAEIRNFHSSEYGDNLPSAGAISARLFPGGDASKCTLVAQGVQPDTNEKGNKGARKVPAQADAA